MNILFIALGGAAGSAFRFLLSNFINKFSLFAFPLGVLCVNILGSAAMGFLAAKMDLSGELKSFLMVGLLGGFTTFSAFSMEAVALLEKQDYLNFALYVFTSVAFSIAAFLLCYKLAA